MGFFALKLVNSVVALGVCAEMVAIAAPAASTVQSRRVVKFSPWWPAPVPEWVVLRRRLTSRPTGERPAYWCLKTRLPYFNSSVSHAVKYHIRW
eukprot:NODE_29717_length_438_cov_1.176849.p1 GENE.NODE_29717_length_438_cov_1.176849~~NODE_29717_length_438_cov_1.176849.p1  ORF type:complete len:94 (+),score=3.88 NODE_29717_length_438_cov_1.176849:2-283(+)